MTEVTNVSNKPLPPLVNEPPKKVDVKKEQPPVETPNKVDKLVQEIKMAKRGLYANIHAKRKRIAAGSGEKMRKKGAKGAPSAKDFKDAAKTAKPKSKLAVRSRQRRKGLKG